MTSEPAGSFHERLVVIDQFLPEPSFRALVDAVLKYRDGQRVHIVGHKRGETIGYEEVRNRFRPIAEFYHSQDLKTAISRRIGATVVSTPMHDQSSCSVLIYDEPGDRIGWHYDYNFYNGRHFTVLLSLVNEHRFQPGLSSASLRTRKNGLVKVIPTPPNTLVLFEGAYVYHGVTALGPDERRIILSMTFCTDPATTAVKDLARRVKDIAYFGVSALVRKC
jgi:hypothetical protein